MSISNLKKGVVNDGLNDKNSGGRSFNTVVVCFIVHMIFGRHISIAC